MYVLLRKSPITEEERGCGVEYGLFFEGDDGGERADLMMAKNVEGRGRPRGLRSFPSQSEDDE
jgi:hypothetical protein